MQRLEKADFLSHVALRKFVPPFMRSEWMAKIWTHLWRRKYNMGVAIFMGVSLASLWKRWRVMAQAEKAKARKSGLKERPLDDLQMPKKSPLTALLGFDLAFLARLPRLFHILYPSIQSKETLVTAFLCLLLMVRTMLSIKIAEAMGYNAKCLVQRKLTRFVVGVIGMGIIIFPAAILSSGSKYFTNILALLFRKRLSRYVHKKYLDSEEMTFYKATLDDKMDNIDQRVSQDIDRFCRTLSHFCANMLKSSFDLMLYTTHLTMVLGFRGPLILYLYFTFGSLFLRFIMPPFAKFAGSLQQLEGIFRYQHSRLIAHAEEIAFYKGTKREQKIVNSSFDVIYNYASSIFKKQAVMGVMDELLVKYGGTLVGYIIVALPVFTVVTSGDSSSEAVAKLAGHLSNEYTLASPLDDYTISSQTSLIKLTATITGDYVNNTQVLINLGRSIARMVVLHREYLLLVGYTGRVFELLELLENVRKRATEEILAARDPQEFEEMEDENEMMKEGYYNSKIDNDKEEEEEEDGLDPEHFSSKHGGVLEEMGRYVAGDHIQFDDVSVVTPDGMALIEGLTFDLPIGKNLLVSGPNGSGKSSLFRVMTKMWPLVKGTIVKPKEELIFYVPQRPYLTIGTLREQVIYPDSVEEMEAKGWTDKELSQLMKALDLLYLVQREGWAKRADWIEVLSGGESQRLAMARLFYHNPRFVILDECTGAIGAEVEAFIYEEMRKRGMTTITVSHRKRTLWRFHDFLLQLFGDGSWEWKQLDRKKEQYNHHYNNNHHNSNNDDNNDGHHHHHHNHNHNHHNNPHRTHHFKSL